MIRFLLPVFYTLVTIIVQQSSASPNPICKPYTHFSHFKDFIELSGLNVKTFNDQYKLLMNVSFDVSDKPRILFTEVKRTIDSVTLEREILIIVDKRSKGNRLTFSLYDGVKTNVKGFFTYKPENILTQIAIRNDNWAEVSYLVNNKWKLILRKKLKNPMDLKYVSFRSAKRTKGIDNVFSFDCKIDYERESK